LFERCDLAEIEAVAVARRTRSRGPPMASSTVIDEVAHAALG